MIIPERIVEIRRVPVEAFPAMQYLVEVVYEVEGQTESIALPAYLFRNGE